MSEQYSKKRLLVVGGPNGAGKTTLANAYLAKGEWLYLGADKIAYEICPERPESVAAAAGREFVERIEIALNGSQSLIVESTLSGRSIGRVLERPETGDSICRLLSRLLTLPQRASRGSLTGSGSEGITCPTRTFGGVSIPASRTLVLRRT